MHKGNYSAKRSWQTQDAKAHFSEVVKKAVHEGEQFIKHRGEEVAVILSKSRYDELVAPNNSLIDFFCAAPNELADIEIQRSKDLPRQCDI